MANLAPINETRSVRAQGSPPTTAPADVTIDLVLEKMENARARLPPISYTLKERRELKNGDRPRVYETVLSMVRDGANWRSERVQIITESGRQIYKYRSRALLTDKWFVLMDFDLPFIKEWEFDSTGDPPEEVAFLARFHSDPELLTWGFDNGNGSLRELYSRADRLMEVTVRKSDSGEPALLEIDLSPRDQKPAKWTSRYTVDPARGYLVTGGQYFDESGGLVGAIRVEVREIAPKVWFPVRVDGWHKFRLVRKTQIEVTDLKVLDDAASEFELRALNPNEGARVLRYYQDGRTEACVVRDGKSIPEEVHKGLRK